MKGNYQAKIALSYPGQASERRTARGTLQLVLGRTSFLAFGYLVSILLARSLGPAEYGVYGIILSVLVWIEQGGRFGLPEAIAKLAPESEARRPDIEQTGQTLLVIVSLLLFLVFWLAAPLISRSLRMPETTFLFRLALLDVPISGVYFASQGVLAGRRDFSTISGGLAVYGLSKLVGISVALYLGLSLFSALLVNILATGCAFLVLARRVFAVLIRPSFAQMNLILRLAFPVGLFLLALQILSRLDLWFLKAIGSEEEEIIGVYVAALNIARVPALAFSAINGVILPSLSMALAKRDAVMARRYVQGAGRFLLITLLPSCVLLAFTAEDLIVLLFSEKYVAGAPFIIPLVFACAFFGIAQVYSDMLVALGRPYLVAGVIFGHIPLALLFNLILIPDLGAIGASMSLLLTSLVVVSVTSFLVFRHLGSLIAAHTLGRVLLATTLMALASSQINLAGPVLLLKYAFLFAVYGLALVVLRELTWNDLKLLALWRIQRT